MTVLAAIALVQCYATRPQDGCAPLSYHDTMAECRVVADDYRRFDTKAPDPRRYPGNSQLPLCCDQQIIIHCCPKRRGHVAVTKRGRGHLGRPTILKQAMTPAQRQRRHRRKQRREKRKAEALAARERNRQRYVAYQTSERKARIDAETQRQMLWGDEWLNMWGQLAEVRNAGIADELVRQLAEAMLADGISVVRGDGVW